MAMDGCQTSQDYISLLENSKVKFAAWPMSRQAIWLRPVTIFHCDDPSTL